LGFFSTLGETLRPLGGDWSVVVLTGDFPALPAELMPYAGTLLSTRAAANRQRFSVWNLGTPAPAFLGAAAGQSAGLVIQNPAEELVAEFDAVEPGLIELDWDRPALARGFHLYDAQLLNAAGQVQRTLPCIAQSPGFDLPGLERYAESLAHVAAARAALAADPLTETNASTARTHLDAALALNPRDASALQLAAEMYDRLKDFKTAASLTGLLVELQPLDGKLSQVSGHRRFLAGELDEAEKALSRARELGHKTPEGAADLGLIHAAHNDPRGALLYFDESLAAQPANQPLWFARADAGAKLGDWNRQAESLEKGVALGGNVLDRRTRLVRLLLDHQETQRATAQIAPGLKELGGNAEPYTIWAGFLEELKRPGEAIAVLRKAGTLAPQREDVRFAIRSEERRVGKEC
jgi:Tfp pilus assembly protein PilF